MTTVAVPGARDVRATLDDPGDASAVVVACPPHPQFGGSRSDQRLKAVSDALRDRDVACLRFDYGPWDGGREVRPEGGPRNGRTANAVATGERRDAANALAWATERYDAVGLFGYSFGAGVALDVADGPAVLAVSALAPDADAAAALASLSCPVQILYGERDDTVDSLPVVERARERGDVVESLPADHHFVGQTGRVATLVADFLAGALDRSFE